MASGTNSKMLYSATDPKAPNGILYDVWNGYNPGVGNVLSLEFQTSAGTARVTGIYYRNSLGQDVPITGVHYEPPPTGLPAWRDSMADFTWKYLDPATLGVDPSLVKTVQDVNVADGEGADRYNPNYPSGHGAMGATGVRGVISAWGGAWFDHTRGYYLICGGGHGDYGGPEVYAWNMYDDVPSCFVRFGLPPTWNPDPNGPDPERYQDGTMRCGHSHGNMYHDTDRDVYLRGAPIQSPFPGTQTGASCRMWEISATATDLDTYQEVAWSGDPFPTGQGHGGGVYDATNQVYWGLTDALVRIWRYTAGDPTLIDARLGTSLPNSGLDWGFNPFYIPEDNVIFLVGTYVFANPNANACPVFLTIDSGTKLISGGFKIDNPQTTGLAPPKTLRKWGHCYIPNARVALFWGYDDSDGNPRPGDASFWRLRLPPVGELQSGTYEWSYLDPGPSNTVTPTRYAAEGTYARLQYIPQIQAVAVVNDWDQYMHVFSINEATV